MSSDVGFILVASNIDNTQRSLIQSWIKQTTEEWWHQLPDVWLVVGKNPTFWRDGLKKFQLPGSAFLVLALKNTHGERWATSNVGNTKWLNNHLPPVALEIEE
jgi:hypothetical protein